LGVAPLAFSTGAGAAARQSLGNGVLGGMLAATFLAIFFVPLFFKLVNDRRIKTLPEDFHHPEPKHHIGAVDAMGSADSMTTKESL
jgi:HAE1 family hydrophobic/amphiphilic exporter-1/multidrug efflux pump